MTAYRFAGFELDEQRAELRGPDGAMVKLRPKTFEMLRLFAANPGRVLSKQELMEAVWPSVHVGEDSLFQCIREIRAALGDEQRQMIRLASGRGYLLAVEVAAGSDGPAAAASEGASAEPAMRRSWGRTGTRVALVAGGVLTAVVGLAAGSTGFVFQRSTPTVAVLPILDVSSDPLGGTLAAGVTDELVDGLARIDNLRVVVPGAGSRPSSELEIRGELHRDAGSWTLKLRAIRASTGEVASVATAAVDAGLDAELQEVRLAAGAGDPLARDLNELLEGDTGSKVSAAGARVVIEQASASISQTSRERFAAAETMLAGALVAEPDSVDLQVALAALQTRGIQMVWYDADSAASARDSGQLLLERAVAARPRSIAALEAQCRFLSATNNFVESLVACAKAASFDPWNGSVLYQIGLAQLFLGRFDDALASFRLADRYDTPAVSRWTWMLGAGWACLVLGRNEEAVEWIERSIAITPASGRSLLLLAVAQQRLGRVAEARDAFGRAMALRPGSTAHNVAPPTLNTSPAYVAASEGILQTMFELGLPEG